jgi:hypothetical protein
MRLRCLVLWVSCSLGLLGPAGVCSGTAFGHAGSVALLHPVWRTTLAGGRQLVVDDGRYQFWVDSRRHAVVTVIDERTGRRSIVRRRGCLPVFNPSDFNPEFEDGPWVLFSCGTAARPHVVLWAITSRRWRAVVLPSSIEGYCGAQSPPPSHGSTCEVEPIAAGAYWIHFFFIPDISPGIHDAYDSISTGKVRLDPTTATTSLDLNSESLTRRICSPLHNPTGINPLTGMRYYAPLYFFGSFALVGSPGYLRLDRCGSRTSTRLGLPTRVSKSVNPYGVPTFHLAPHAIVWQANLRSLQAVLLPSLRRVSLVLPRLLNTTTSALGVIVSPFRIFVQARGRVWSIATASIRAASVR